MSASRVSSSSAIRVWRVPLAQPAAALDAALTLLDDAERRRADRLAQAADRRAFVLVRAQLRRLLGTALGLPPAALSFVYGPAGKPALMQAGGPHFNVAHSGDWGLIATWTGGPVGVDIEADRPVPDPDGIAALLFGAGDRVALAAALPADRAATFLRLWTCTEARLKAAGTGLTARADLAFVARPIAAPHGYAAAVAHPPGPPPPIDLRDATAADPD